MLLGLGFTAILSEGSQVQLYKPHFDFFLQHRDFTQHADKLEILSVSVAEIVCGALCPFHTLGHPSYYDDFIKALVVVLKSSEVDSLAVEKGIRAIIQGLMEGCD